jgi:hypothetical protein
MWVTLATQFSVTQDRPLFSSIRSRANGREDSSARETVLGGFIRKGPVSIASTSELIYVSYSITCVSILLGVESSGTNLR